jgi:A/G-specific adenine glycosylase
MRDEGLGGHRSSPIPHPPSPKRRHSFQTRLLRWFARYGRDLPWRRTRDPYHVTVSEFMLQQTQVSRVLEYYPRFLERFPTVADLAAARPRAVMEQWDGLGYYARARNLHALAREVVRRHDGNTPREPEELMKLPGVGRYTAGAVASFAYEKPVPAVDTNVARVLRRYFFGMRDEGLGKRPRRTPPSSRIPHPRNKGIWLLAEALVPRNGRRAWSFNQGLMELGALVCVARKPRCAECPVRGGCRTARTWEKGEGRGTLR